MRLRLDLDTGLMARIGPIADALHERERAHAKHRAHSMEQSGNDDKSLRILVEEVGECAKVLNDTDSGDVSAIDCLPMLREELVQVMAMTWAWIDSIDRTLGES